ncbi:MAG: phosphoenolpyruvate--protein phosphotransferase [Spirochaetales bacterium]|nr:phosphoenolpyruvate--protein phosphotransferase [Spirochaetales bacterium]
MNKKSYTELLEDLLEKISLFEKSDEVDELLREALSLIMGKSRSSLGTAYVYDDIQGELVFRVGFDHGDYWDRCRCGGCTPPERLALDNNEVGLAFQTGLIKMVNYDEPPHGFSLYSKIIIPITRGVEKEGVVIMMHQEQDAYSNVDLADLKSAVSLLGDMLAEASILLEQRAKIGHEKKITLPRVIKGIRTSRGVVEAKALPIWTDMEDAVENFPQAGSKNEELMLFTLARERSLEQLEKLTESLSSDEEDMVSLIFTAQLLMLKDMNFTGKIRKLIEEGKGAPRAVQIVVGEYADIFSAMSEVRLAEKAQDVRDLGFRLLNNMSESREEGFSYKNRIVLSRHIYPSDLYRLSVEGVAGLVLRGAAVTAHISILAKSLNLPVLITDDKALMLIEEGTPLILDGDKGELHINPDELLRKKLGLEKRARTQRGVYTLRGSTSDGTAVNVMANVNILKDAREAVKQGAEGIGLYRSEFPFIIKNDFLSEDQQYKIYRSIVATQKGKPVVLRTADIGGDKLMQGRQEAEANPFLGVRGIRFSLANRPMFREQIRAMLRAGHGADLRILLPMVSDVEEVVQAKEEIGQCMEQLEFRGVEFNRNPKVGAMVELPSAALSVADLAEETDFLSIGTNDLTMYLLAVDRTNDNLSHLYRSHHPTVLRVLNDIAREAEKCGTDLSVCGDVAGDPLMVPFFVGLGIRKLSVPPLSVEAVKTRLGQFTLEEAERTAREMLAIRKPSELEAYRLRFNESFEAVG